MVISREELYQLVWSKPITKIAKELEVSDSYLARICEALRVPRPGAGYWTKVAVGRTPPQSPLPAAVPGQVLEWKKGSALPLYVPERRSAVRNFKRGDENSSKTRITLHPILSGARSHFENTRPVEGDEYLRPFKKNLVDITTSLASITRAIELANKLFNALEKEGYAVLLAHANCSRLDKPETREVATKQARYDRYWRPAQPTVVHIDGIFIGLALVEMSESVLMRYVNGDYVRESDYKHRAPHFLDHSWTTTRDIPSGRFRLVAYSAHPLVTWSTSWQETGKERLDDQIPTIISTLSGVPQTERNRINEVKRARERQEREWRAEEKRLARSEDKSKIRKSLQDSEKELDEIVRTWVRRRDLESFFEGIEAHAQDLSIEEAELLRQRIDLARKVSGSLGPVEHFLSWRTPMERYKPKYNHAEEEE